ncbi:MAG: OB-fold domain-containing protein [Caulobacter sp.]|nr:OB-fold domain-containing protein [Caulobacter sp.]
MTDEPKRAASPEIWPEAQPYWEAAAEGRLLIKTCNNCGEKHFYPRPFCPFCMSDDTAWVECSGGGEIYSFTVTARAPVFQAPALITLDEGPVMMSAVIDADPAGLAIGQRVRVTFVPTADGQPIPVFRPE